MRKFVFAFAAFVLVVAGFGGGYYVRSVQSEERAELEDLALGNVLEEVGYAHFMAKGDYTAMRSLLDVNLDAHLTRLRAHSGSIDDAQFEVARTRGLNAAALIWEAEPPFQSPEWRENSTNSSWWNEWSNAHQQNLALLQSAKAKCQANPSLRCKAQPPTINRTGDKK
jgi:hypothetical protein